MSAHRAPIDHLFGQRFHRLTILREVPTKPNCARRVTCRCACGTVITTNVINVTKGLSKSCGCLKRELFSARFKTHGMTKTPEYRIWAGMKKRCYNVHCKQYADWGGRGIRVCRRWLHSFLNFFRDMGPRPSPAHTLERLDNSKGYSPSNCVWATRTAQSNNSRHNHLLTYKGRTFPMAEWARIYGLPDGRVILKRLNRGWPLKDALTLPLQANQQFRKMRDSCRIPA